MSAAWFKGKEPTRGHLDLHSNNGMLAMREERWKLIPGTKASGGHRGATPGWVRDQGG